LQKRLDLAKLRHLDSPTLGDFRAPPEIVKAESAALADARFLYTPHRAIAAFDKKRTVLLDWAMPKLEATSRRGGRMILFPASALGRKGAYALREAMKGLDAELVVTGGARERDGSFWGDIRLREAPVWPKEIAAVVLPAVIEHQPRALLKALAMGLPVIATAECGLGDMPGVVTVPVHDARVLREAIIEALDAGARPFLSAA
jgi:vancomycin resistance protein VanW